MKNAANFRVDPRLASLLGENYRSTEQALKELIDNAWDANAENVWIHLPEPLTTEPIIVRDDGTGMTEREVRSEYLNIANDRRSRKGEFTPSKGRPVKGRKGIGKFAGLVAVDVMDIETKARGTRTTLQIVKQDLLSSHRDLERVDLPIAAEPCDQEEHGTTITLSQLNEKFAFPTAIALRELLVLEYGRQPDFCILVNSQPLAHEDIPGQQFSADVDLPNAGKVKINFTIMENPTTKKHAGIVMRVGGKVVGRPSFLGLDEREEIPNKMLFRVVGEIEADSLEADVTADWGAIIENSKGYQEAREWAQAQVAQQMEQTFASDVNLAKARRQKEINQRLAQLPEHRRRFANDHLERVIRRFYGEAEEKIDVVVSFVLDALEKDEYWEVCRRIEAARRSDVVTFAEALETFGLVDMVFMARQAARRLELLDALDELERKQDTLEKEMHKALDTNLWVFGPQYSLMASNVTLARVVEEYGVNKFTGERAKSRPDLLLAQSVDERYLLIEFKRPSEPVGRKAEAQAKEYRDDLTSQLGVAMDIIVIGGEVDPTMSAHYKQLDLRFLSYNAVISTARAQLQWLIRELTTDSHRTR